MSVPQTRRLVAFTLALVVMSWTTGRPRAAAIKVFTTTLTGAQQVPAVVSGGTGTGTVVLNAAEDQIVVNLTFSGLTTPAILAHIHGPAPVGGNAVVLFDFAAVVPNATAGTIPAQTFAITPAQVADLKAGLYYFNVHSSNFPGGEIRGQILGPAAAVDVTLDRTSLQFAATHSGAAFVKQTRSQTVRILQSGTATAWTATANQPWITVTPTSGAGSATLTIAVQFVPGLAVSGVTNGAVALTFAGAGNVAGPIAVRLATVPNGASANPFGVIDTPINGSNGVTGSVAVTGWALDDIEVRGVRVVRDPVPGEGANLVFIGDAVLVDGARPDVGTAFPTAPLNSRGGWGYLLLTNFLPGLGNGTFRLHAIADDAEGHSVDLGTKTITCSNAIATKPFGAIDTPAPGEVVSGIIPNFGWVLARTPALAFPPNGTVQVVVDGVFGGSPSGWTNRIDITTLFPLVNYPGVPNAVGVAGLDTTTLQNGVHTIAWVVTADNGQADGIGSRFFTVANGASAPGAVASGAIEPPMMMTAVRTKDGPVADAVNAAPIDRAPLTARRGYNIDAPFRTIAVADAGRATVHSEEMDRIEIRLGEGVTGEHTGYLRAGTELSPLPIGSHLDRDTGVFTWQPGVGFVHAYDLVFVRWSDGHAVARREVRVVLNPRGSNRVGAQVVIDRPSAGANIAQPFAVAGWALDLDDSIMTGVDTLHVWAYPVQGGKPVFLGVAAYGGARPDVAALFGEQFRKSGYGLTVDTLPPGAYDLAVFAWSSVDNRFMPARLVRVTIR